MIKHPNYQAETFANNIAMLHLKESIQYTGNNYSNFLNPLCKRFEILIFFFFNSVTAQPICLLPKNNYIDVGINAILVGWGKFANRKGKKIINNSFK